MAPKRITRSSQDFLAPSPKIQKKVSSAPNANVTLPEETMTEEIEVSPLQTREVVQPIANPVSTILIMHPYIMN